MDDWQCLREFVSQGSQAAFREIVGRHVDLALKRLEPAERDAILLRFFEARSFREVGAAMNISEEAAKKRVWRGIEKLRQMLTPDGGASVPAATVVGILAAGVHPARAALASAAAASALGGAGAAI